MYDNIFSVITIKEKQTRFKNETALANLFRTGDFISCAQTLTFDWIFVKLAGYQDGIKSREV